jgi:DNA invertase Pin-like site-specific DNA recombinase/predicted metal-binding protein
LKTVEKIERKLPVLKTRKRVAAYARVSMESERMQHSLSAQVSYYSALIQKNPEWEYAGVFADYGISGTGTKKREEFNRMLAECEAGNIDIILTKSIQRFARNTVDLLNTVRHLKDLGIEVRFEKENINSLEEDSELRITLSGAFAQSESESISANVTWGKRRAMEAGKVSIQYKKLYGYRKGEDGQPEIIPKQAEIVRWLYERYLTGASLRMIKDELEQQGVKCFEDSPEWTISRIRSILQNEKYCGDVLMQKTFRQDFINRKAIKNTGQLPMYLIENHHEGIVSREKYDAVQAEMARRNAAKSPSKNAVTGMASYASKYALSERLVCGECGTLYRRCTWTRNGEKRVVWRCVSRLDYGKKYCHNSPTLDEAPLQQAILAVLNTAMADKNSLIRQITAAMETELIPFPGGTMSLGDIECRLRVLEQQFQTLLEKATDDPAAYGGQFKEILDEQTFLKEKRSVILANNNEQTKANQRIMDAAQTLENASPYITEWDESAVRQLVETVKILSKDEVAVTLKGGIEICQKIMY